MQQPRQQEIDFSAAWQSHTRPPLDTPEGRYGARHWRARGWLRKWQEYPAHELRLSRANGCRPDVSGAHDDCRRAGAGSSRDPAPLSSAQQGITHGDAPAENPVDAYREPRVELCQPVPEALLASKGGPCALNGIAKTCGGIPAITGCPLTRWSRQFATRCLQYSTNSITPQP